MKKTFLSVLFIGSIALTQNSFASAVATNAKFATADFASLIDRSPYMGDVEKLAKSKRAELEKAAAKFNEQLAEKGQELSKSLKEDGSASLSGNFELAFTQSQFDHERELTNLNFKNLNQKATLEVQVAKEKCNGRVRGIIRDYAKENGYSAILNSSNPDQLIVCNDSEEFDLTDKLSKHIESTYKNDQKKETLLASVVKSKDQKDQKVLMAATDDKKVTDKPVVEKA